MTHQPSIPPATLDSAGRNFVQLCEALALAEQVAGRSPAPREEALDEAAHLSVAYDRALPLVRERFDALADETAAWVAAAVEALLQAEGGPAPRAAAARLAAQLEKAIRELSALLRSSSA
ncbi:MAG: hypothetical protein ACT4OE_07305 [Sphingosinicella sp.]